LANRIINIPLSIEINFYNFLASQKGYYEIAKLLIENNADIDATSKSGDNALIIGK
jgi:ankyrin repeat protein